MRRLIGRVLAALDEDAGLPAGDQGDFWMIAITRVVWLTSAALLMLTAFIALCTLATFALQN